MTPRYAKAQLAGAGPAVERSQADQALIDSGSIKISEAVQTAHDLAWPAGDVMVVNAGRTTIGFVEKRDGMYFALDASGAELGAFRSSQEAFSIVIDSARAKKGGAT